MGMFGEFEIATCNRAAEALRPEQSQQAADAGGQAIPVTCAAPLHCLAASPRQREGAASGFHGQQRITLSDGITPSRLPTLLALSWQEEPDVELRLFEVSLSQQIKGLHGDLYDLGPSLVKWVTTSWLRRFGAPPLMVAAPAWHPLLKHKRISLDEVLRYPLVLVTHMHTGVMNVRSNECCRG